MSFEDLLYDKQDGVATITINRPKVLNAFRKLNFRRYREAR
jgi:1,4-dihydroxy-2-naphthoyl-CoA synthase